MEMRYGTKNTKLPKKTAKKAKSGKTARKTKNEKTTYKDVIIMFLAEGLSLVEKNVEMGKVSVSAVRKAAADLQGQFPERADLLQAFAEKVQPVSLGRGRTPAKIGDERDYKAQKIGEGEPFLRLPLSVLGVKKGQILTVRFQADRLTVAKKAVDKAAG
jgi:hypothetical protein